MAELAVDAGAAAQDEVVEERPFESAKASARLLFPYLRPYRREIVLVLLMVAVETAFNAWVPLSFSYLIDDALIPRDKQALAILLAALGASVVVVGFTGIARDRLYACVSASVVADIRSHLFDHLQLLSLGYYQRTKAGDILARFSGDAVTVENSLASIVPWAVAPTFDLVVYTVLLFVLDWRLALGAMLVWPIALLGPRKFGPRALSASYEKRGLEADAVSVVQENLAGQSVVKAFGLEESWRDSFAERNATLRSKSAYSVFMGQLIERSALSGVFALYVGVVAVGAVLVFNGLLSIGNLVAFQALFLALGYALIYISQYLPNLVQGLGGFRRIGELLAEDPQVVDLAGAAPLAPFRDAIAYDGVSFAYTADGPGLRGFDAEIRRGESVAFVGPSGSGKSTALSLLLRFYDPSGGSVCIDGVDVRDATQHSLRSQMGVVFQESVLFDGTVRENIRFGAHGASDDQVEAAAKAAEIHDVLLALPNGYDTVVGERGGLLSGGQRQRVAIARALVRDPAILVLDEATSALDPGTEAAVNETLARAGAGRTTVAVTHRLASVTGCDRIFVLDRGVLAESGSHAELLAAGGAYAALWARQAGFTLTDDRAEVEPERLAQVPILSGLDQELLAEMASRFTTEHVAAGQPVIREGDEGDRFYLVVRGRLVVTRRADDGEEVQVNVHEDGDHFGEIALLRRAPRIATVTAEMPSVLLALARDHFLDLVERAPEVKAAMEERRARYLAEWEQLR